MPITGAFVLRDAAAAADLKTLKAETGAWTANVPGVPDGLLGVDACERYSGKADAVATYATAEGTRNWPKTGARLPPGLH